jgi:predicted transposase YbfD/YdcC
VPHLSWPGAAQVCRLERITRRNGKELREVHYAITSLSPQRADAKQLLHIWRSHWAIENRLHWVRDVTFGEDGCRIRRGHGPQVCSAFRNAAISLLRLSGVTNIAAELRAHALQVNRLLAKLGILRK